MWQARIQKGIIGGHVKIKRKKVRKLKMSFGRDED
jgi:hypothetical protein